MKTPDFWPCFFPEKHVGRAGVKRQWKGWQLTTHHFGYCPLKNVMAIPDGPFKRKGWDFLGITLLNLFYFGVIPLTGPTLKQSKQSQHMTKRTGCFGGTVFPLTFRAPFFGKFDTDSLSPLWNKLLKSLNLDGAPSEIPKDSLDVNVPIIYWFLLFDNYSYEL